MEKTTKNVLRQHNDWLTEEILLNLLNDYLNSISKWGFFWGVIFHSHTQMLSPPVGTNNFIIFNQLRNILLEQRSGSAKILGCRINQCDGFCPHGLCWASVDFFRGISLCLWRWFQLSCGSVSILINGTEGFVWG